VRVTPQLDILDTVFISNVDGGQNIPSITFNGADYIVAFLDARLDKGIVATRVSSQGIVLDTGYTVDDGNNYPAAVRGTDHTLILWSREFDAVCGRLVDDQALPQDTVLPVAAINASAARPAAAFDGSNHLVVWPDFGVTGTLDIFGRILVDGVPVDTPLALVQGPEAENNPDVVFDGENYFLVWESGAGRILGLFLDRNAKPVTGPIVLSDTVFYLRQHPAVAAGPGYRFCFWSEYGDDYDLYGSIDHGIGIADGGIGPVGIVSVAPNPFRTTTNIRWTMDEGRKTNQNLTIRIYDVSGKLVYDFSSLVPRPSSFVSWNGTDENGCSVPEGVYFAQLPGAKPVKIIKIK